MSVDWIENHETRWRFGPEKPGPGFVALGFPPAWDNRPWIFANFVADKNGLVVADNLPDPTAILGKVSFPDSQPLRPDTGAEADWRFMRNLRAYADAVMWGANTLRLQPEIIPDLKGPDPNDEPTLRAFRKSHGLAEYPSLILVTNSGQFDFSLPAFNTPGLKTTILTNAMTAELLETKAQGTKTALVGAGRTQLDMASALEHLRLQKIDYLLCEGGHSLIVSLHEQGFLDEVFVTTSNIALDPALVQNPKYMFKFEEEGDQLIAFGTAGQFEFRRWRFSDR